MTINNNFVYYIFLPCHIVAMLAVLALPWTFDLTTLMFIILGYVLFPGLGAAVALHRIYTHKSIEIKSYLKIPLLILSTFCLQGNTIVWTAIHRSKHHRYADTDNDPHSPRHGFFTSYFKWIFDWQKSFEPKYAVDLIRDKWHLWFAKNYNWIIISTYIIVGLISIKFLIYAMIVPAAYSFHQAGLVNWLCHQRKNGYRSFNTNDNSVNNKWLAWITWGEAWHNNHHFCAKSFDFGKSVSTKNEFDPCLIFRRLLEK